ncbi:MAG: gluconate 2-dehydrogenase subunit 3 family protein [Saprospiraceae bacterium]
MKRRDILRHTAFATGAAISAPLLSSLLVGCQSEVATNSTAEGLVFFNSAEFELIKKIADIILPKTDSPSATEVGVHEMIDHMVGNVYSEKEQATYKTGFAALTKAITGNDLLTTVTHLNGGDKTLPEAARKAFINLKQQTIAYYLSSKEIGMNHLSYLPVPGEYEACITVEEAGGKAWAM